MKVNKKPVTENHRPDCLTTKIFSVEECTRGLYRTCVGTCTPKGVFGYISRKRVPEKAVLGTCGNGRDCLPDGFCKVRLFLLVVKHYIVLSEIIEIHNLYYSTD